MKFFPIILLFITLIICEEYDVDVKICENTQNQNDCSKAPITISGSQCCSTKDYWAKSCIYFDEDTYFYSTNRKLIIQEREERGFKLAVYDKDLEYYEKSKNQFKYEYQCPKGKVIESSDDFIYTDEEKEILKKDNHCLNYEYKLKIKTIDKIEKSMCNNAVLLESTKKEGITCGFYDFEVYLKNGTKFNLGDCLLVNSALFKFNLETLKSYFNTIISDLLEIYNIELDEEEAQYSFKTFVSDSKGTNKSFDSETGELIDNSKSLTNITKSSDSKTDKVSDNSKTLAISSIILLLIPILL